MSTLSFETLIKGKESYPSVRWYPISVDVYKRAIKLDYSVENTPALQSNLAYSMQYLEFIEKEFSELDVSSVIYVMLVKTYIITGMSVLEGIFSNIIKSNRWWKMSDVESMGVAQTNETKFDGEKMIVKTELLKKVDPYPVQMNLDELIKILDRHHKVLDVNHLVYPALKRLKNLRNRVHLQKAENSTDHDYNAFGVDEKKEMGRILYEILTSKMVTDMPQTFEFLKKNY